MSKRIKAIDKIDVVTECISIRDAAALIRENTGEDISLSQVRRLCDKGENDGGLAAQKMGKMWVVQLESAKTYKRLRSRKKPRK